MKIENMRVQVFNKPTEFNDFVCALKKLEVDQSFVIEKLLGNHRLAISVIQIYDDKKFATRKEGVKFRVGRIR